MAEGALGASCELDLCEPGWRRQAPLETGIRAIGDLLRSRPHVRGAFGDRGPIPATVGQDKST